MAAFLMALYLPLDLGLASNIEWYEVRLLGVKDSTAKVLLEGRTEPGAKLRLEASKTILIRPHSASSAKVPLYNGPKAFEVTSDEAGFFKMRALLPLGMSQVEFSTLSATKSIKSVLLVFDITPEKIQMSAKMSPRPETSEEATGLEVAHPGGRPFKITPGLGLGFLSEVIKSDLITNEIKLKKTFVPIYTVTLDYNRPRWAVSGQYLTGIGDSERSLDSYSVMGDKPTTAAISLNWSYRVFGGADRSSGASDNQWRFGIAVTQTERPFLYMGTGLQLHLESLKVQQAELLGQYIKGDFVGGRLSAGLNFEFPLSSDLRGESIDLSSGVGLQGRVLYAREISASTEWGVRWVESYVSRKYEIDASTQALQDKGEMKINETRLELRLSVSL